MTQINPELSMTLTDAVAEVLANLTGLDLSYDPEQDRFRAVARAVNRALRANALEAEWSYYATITTGGPTTAGVNVVTIPTNRRPRIKGDDAVRLVDDNGTTVTWAYFLPRDAITKYAGRGSGLWVSSVGQDLQFSRPLAPGEAGLTVEVPTMRAPVQFELPATGDPVPQATLDQPIDFAYPDLIVARAAYYYAQTDPVMQPRVQTLEGDYKDLMYQLMERDDANTDSPYLNDFALPVQGSIAGGWPSAHQHPHADDRRWW